MKYLIVFLLLVTGSIYSQNYEVYIGPVISKNKDMHANYMLGVNYIHKSNQNREYLNNQLFGIEYSAMMSGNMNFGSKSLVSNEEDCNCDIQDLNLSNQYSIKKEIRAVSLNLGVQTCRTCWLKQLYLIADVTNYYYVTKVNNSKVSDEYQMQISGGLKHFTPINGWFLTQTIKYNPQAISFGLGFSI